MAMYECTQCGDENSCFPQVIIGLNSKIDYGNEEFTEKYNNLFERKFKEFTLDIAEELKIPEDIVSQWHISEVWDRFSGWFVENSSAWFCSIECATKWLAEKEALDDYSI